MVAGREGLRVSGPDTFLAGARALVLRRAGRGLRDALAGVARGRAGGFAYVVGVDRSGGRCAGERGASSWYRSLRAMEDLY